MAQSIPAKVCAMLGTPKSMIKARTHKHQINNEKSNSLLSCYGHWRSAACSERKVGPVERDIPERQRNNGGDRSSRPTTIRQSLGLDFHKHLCRPTVHHHQERGAPLPPRPFPPWLATPPSHSHVEYGKIPPAKPNPTGRTSSLTYSQSAPAHSTPTSTKECRL